METEDSMNLSERSGGKELFSGEQSSKENSMNLSERSGDKELFSGEQSSKENSIYFYGVKNEYAYMSNFYPSTFYENRIKYNCSEQYFMYHKCLTFDITNNNLLEKILNETSPTKIKKLGRSVNNYNEEIWSNKRYEIMVNALQ